MLQTFLRQRPKMRAVAGIVYLRGRLTRRTGMWGGAGTVTSISPRHLRKGRSLRVLSAADEPSTRDGGFSRSFRRKAPRFFDAPARTGPEKTSSASRCLAHPERG